MKELNKKLLSFLLLFLLLSCVQLDKSNLETKNRQPNAVTFEDLEKLDNWKGWEDLEYSTKECMQDPYENFCKKDCLSCLDSIVFSINSFFCFRKFENCMEKWIDYCKKKEDTQNSQ